MTAVVWHNLPIGDSDGAYASAAGLVTVPNTGASGSSLQPHSAFQAAFLLVGSVAESWGGSFTAGQSITLIVSGTTYKLLEGSRIMSATGSATASLSAAPLAAWAGVLNNFD